MFYIKYLWAEIFKRRARTIIMVLGLGLASAIIIAIVSFSQTLSDSQRQILNPLQSVGTDLMVTRTINAAQAAHVDATTQEEYHTQGYVPLDLSKLGEPGTAFTDDTLLPGTLLTFDQNSTNALDPNLIGDFAIGLILNIAHREGTVPKVTASIKTGGEKIIVDGNVPRPTEAEQEAINKAIADAMKKVEDQGLDPKSPEGSKIINDAIEAATPERLKRTRTEITTPEKIYTKDVGPIETDIRTQHYIVAGVDTSKHNIGLILPSQVTQGSYFNGEGQIIISKSFADKSNKKVGDEVEIKKTKFTVVGIVEPTLYTNVADYYLPLGVLQKLAGKEGRANILLAKTTNAGKVEEAGAKLKELFPGAVVVNSKDTAEKVSGSLLLVASVTQKFVGIISVTVIVAACVIAALLTISSINKRTREIGTLKAIGWSNNEVLRQISLENLSLGILGALAGVGLGLLLIVGLNQSNLSFDATVQSLNSALGGDFTSSTPPANIAKQIQLHITPQLPILLIGAGAALIGSFVAGLLAAIKVARLKPQEALRSLE